MLPLAIVVCVLARLAMTLPSTEIRYWSALLVVFSGAFFLPHGRGTDRVKRSLPFLERSLQDSCSETWERPTTSVCAPMAGVSTPMERCCWSQHSSGGRAEFPAEASSPSWPVGLAFGAFLFLELSLLSLPNGIYRWSDGSYFVLVPALLAVTVFPLVRRCGNGFRSGWGLTLRQEC